MDHPGLLQLLQRQHGVASNRQLADLGMSGATIWRARRDGILLPLTTHVVRAADHPDTFDARAMAAHLQFGDGHLTGTTAGVLYGLRSMPRGRIEVALPERSRMRCPPWIATRVDRHIGPHDVVLRGDGLAVATPHRMLLDLAAAFNDHRFERAAEDAWYLKLVTPETCARFLESLPSTGRHGVARFGRWVRAAAPRERPTQSNFERDLLRTIRLVGLPEPECQYALMLANGEVIHLDLAWPDIRLAVEPGHSHWHRGVLKTRADMARDRACGELGWQVLRYDEAAQQDLAAVGRELQRIHRARVETVRQPSPHV